jgi:hypothetical protein
LACGEVGKDDSVHTPAAASLTPATLPSEPPRIRARTLTLRAKASRLRDGSHSRLADDQFVAVLLDER